MKRRALIGAAGALALAAAGSAAAATIHGVGSPNPREGTPPDRLAEGFGLRLLARGVDPLENPSGAITRFGLLNDRDQQTIEATKTEPDQNTYLVLRRNPAGRRPATTTGAASSSRATRTATTWRT